MKGRVMKKCYRTISGLFLAACIIAPVLTYAEAVPTVSGNEIVKEEGEDVRDKEDEGNPDITETGDETPSDATDEEEQEEQIPFVYSYAGADEHLVICTSGDLETVSEACAYNEEGVCVKCGHKKEEPLPEASEKEETKDSEEAKDDKETQSPDQKDTEAGDQNDEEIPEKKERTLKYEDGISVSVKGVFSDDAELSVSEKDAASYDIESADPAFLISPQKAFEISVTEESADGYEVTVSGVEEPEGFFAFNVHKDEDGEPSYLGSFMSHISFTDDSLGKYIISAVIDKADITVKPEQTELSPGILQEAEKIVSEKIAGLSADADRSYDIVDSFDLSVPEGTEFPITLTFNANVRAGMDIMLLHKAGTDWEEIVPDEVSDGFIKASFNSLSPLVVVRTDAQPIVITFKDGDKVLSSEVYQKGKSVSAPQIPEKKEDGKEYRFDGWSIGGNDIIPSDAIPPAEQSVTYNTHYKEIIRHKVQFINKDGSIIYECEAEHGSTLQVPENTGYIDKYGIHTFKSWEPELSLTVEADAVYKAVYGLEEQNRARYRIIWKDYDGTEIKNAEGFIDTIDTQKPENPKREADGDYIYTFAFWDCDKTFDDAFLEWKSAGADIKKEIIVINTAKYTAIDAERVKYTITFKDYDGTVISKESYVKGAKITVPGDPERKPDKSYSYTFKGWTPDISETVEKAVTYTASYTKKALPKEYSIIFKDYDGRVISEKTYKAGDEVEKPDDPERKEDDNYTYAFSKWTPAFSQKALKDTVYTAAYTKTAKTANKLFTITFRDYNGAVISENEYKSGEEIKIPDDPSRGDDTIYTYRFSSWYPALSPKAVKDAVYTAQYTKTRKQTASAGGISTALKSGNQNTARVTNSQVQKAAAVKNTVPVSAGTCSVTFRDWDGTILSEKTYKKGEAVTIPPDPVRKADENYTYSFKNWSPVVSEKAEKTVIYTAQYVKTKISVTEAPVREAVPEPKKDQAVSAASKDEAPQASDGVPPEVLPDPEPEKYVPVIAENTVVTRPEPEAVLSGREKEKLPDIVWYVLCAVLIAGVILALIYGKVWFMMMNLLFKGKRSAFHGILVDEDTKGVQCIIPEELDESFKMVQSIIDESEKKQEGYEKLKQRILSEKCETILPYDAKMMFMVSNDRETVTSDIMDADELTLFDILDQYAGQGVKVVANFFSKSADLDFNLSYAV